MGGTAQTQSRDAANRFTRTKPDPDAIPHRCERLARSFTGEAGTSVVIAPPTQKRMRNPRMVYAAPEYLQARKIDLDADFSGDADYGIAPSGRLRSAAAIVRDGTLCQHKAHKSSHVRLGLPSMLVPDFADDAFAVAMAGRITGYPGELLWAKWAGMDCRRIAAVLAWGKLVADGEIDPAAPWQRGARRAVLHGVSRSLSGEDDTQSYETAARAARMRTLAFTRISKLAQQEVRGALRELESAFVRARSGNDFPTELALNI